MALITLDLRLNSIKWVGGSLGFVAHLFNIAVVALCYDSGLSVIFLFKGPTVHCFFKKYNKITRLLCFVVIFMYSLLLKAQSVSTAQEAVQSFYKAYLSAKNLKAQDLIMHTYFTHDFYALYAQQMKKDGALNEVGCINDFDVVTGSQEVPLHFSFEKKAQIKGDKAELSIRFDFGSNNYRELILKLQVEGKYWLIDDMVYPDIQQSLRQMIHAC